MVKEISCKHANINEEATDESVYIYDIGSDQELYLCPSCNMNLAGEIAKQQAVETFLPKLDIDTDTTTD